MYSLDIKNLYEFCINLSIKYFDTFNRTMTISLVMMFGRLGALIGNVVFPYLLQTGCLPPFLLVGLIQFGELEVQ